MQPASRHPGMDIDDIGYPRVRVNQAESAVAMVPRFQDAFKPCASILTYDATLELLMAAHDARIHGPFVRCHGASRFLVFLALTTVVRRGNQKYVYTAPRVRIMLCIYRLQIKRSP